MCKAERNTFQKTAVNAAKDGSNLRSRQTTVFFCLFNLCATIKMLHLKMLDMLYESNVFKKKSQQQVVTLQNLGLFNRVSIYTRKIGCLK